MRLHNSTITYPYLSAIALSSRYGVSSPSILSSWMLSFSPPAILFLPYFSSNSRWNNSCFFSSIRRLFAAVRSRRLGIHKYCVSIMAAIAGLILRPNALWDKRQIHIRDRFCVRLIGHIYQHRKDNSVRKTNGWFSRLKQRHFLHQTLNPKD